MIRIPPWQNSLYDASIGIATLLDEIDDCNMDEKEQTKLYQHAELLQLHITRLEGILYKEKSHAV